MASGVLATPHVIQQLVWGSGGPYAPDSTGLSTRPSADHSADGEDLALAQTADGQRRSERLRRRLRMLAHHTSIERFLERQRIPFTTFAHRPAFTALEQSAVSHVPGWNWAKAVVCMADEEPVLAVLPAPCRIDLERLKRLVGARTLRLATEPEMAPLYPAGELGTMPPPGRAYAGRVFVERSLAGNPELVFDAGSHTRAIRMHYNDFAEVARPTVGAFGRLPAPRASRPQAQRVATRPLF
jgi:Ala-tRNA(Pro) deacylase